MLDIILQAYTITTIGLAWGIPGHISAGLVQTESSFRPGVVSSAGAIGLTQVRPVTGLWFCGLEPSDLYHPHANLACGFAYLADLRRRFGSWARALAAYNVGPTRHSAYPSDGQSYAKKVLGEM